MLTLISLISLACAAFDFPLIVGDVSSSKAAVAVRTTTTAARIALTLKKNNAIVKTLVVATDDALAGSTSATLSDESILALPLLHALEAQGARGTTKRVSLKAGQHELQFVDHDEKSLVATFSATFVDGQCYLIALTGDEDVLVLPDSCVPARESSDSAYVRVFAAHGSASVQGFGQVANRKIGSYVRLGKGRRTFQAGAQSIQADLIGGHSYTLVVLKDGSLGLWDFGVGGKKKDSPDAVAYAHVIGMADEAVDLTPAQDAAKKEALRAAQSSVNKERTAHAWLTGLEANTEYTIEASTDSEQGPLTRFKTAPADTSNNKITFGVTSCLGTSEPSYASLAHAAKAKLDFAVLLGDTVYADGDRTSTEFRSTWSNQLSRPSGLKDLFTSTSVIGLSDDHELDDDWDLDNTNAAEIVVAKRAFKEAIPAFYGASAAAADAALHDDGAILFRSIRYGNAKLIAIDSRFERKPSIKQYISPSQMAWLKNELLDTTVKFKFILNTIPITDWSDILFSIEQDNRWNHPNFREQRKEILSFIDAQKLTGVLWLTGDFHFGGLSRIGDDEGDDGYDQFEVMAGPGGSSINPFVLFRLDTLQRLADGIFGGAQFIKIIRDHTYTRIIADPATMRVELEWINKKGKVAWGTTLDLSKPKTKIVGKGWSLFRDDGPAPEDMDSQEVASASSLTAIVASIAAIAGFFFARE